MSTRVEVRGLRTRDQITRIAGELVSRRGSEVEIDFTPLDRTRSSQVRVTSTWGAVLANLILGELRGSQLSVRLPRNHGLVLQLARAGILFAVAKHPSCEIVEGPPGIDDQLMSWQEDWQPADPVQASFFGGDENSPAELGERFLAFLNPDRSPMATADAERAHTIAPWLTRLTRRVLSDPVQRDHLLSDVNMAVSELAENIVHHAKLIDWDSCYVFVYATKGPSGDSANRLSIVAHDTGIGMDASMGEVLDDLDVAERVVAPFNMRMPRYGRDRGKGLARVISMAKGRGGASLFVATSVADPSHGSVVVHGKKDGEFSSRYEPRLPIHGTIVSVSFQLSFPTGPRSAVRHAQREAARLRPEQMELLGSNR